MEPQQLMHSPHFPCWVPVEYLLWLKQSWRQISSICLPLWLWNSSIINKLSPRRLHSKQGEVLMSSPETAQNLKEIKLGRPLQNIDFSYIMAHIKSL